SVVDLPLGFRQKTIEAFRWSGDDNILRFRGTGLFWDARAAGRDLSSWRQRWCSDGRSVEAEPTRFVARRWELLPGTPGAGEGPGEHAYG
ncbi:hypothetical protein ACTUQ0_14735, partial [Listeria monocytogenes]|uniref:hypothetical protein n=1 Tax=Listeria monocytogenes TaxID=1639 RepID=UPI003FA49465